MHLFQLATPLLDFILVTYSIMDESLSLWLSLQLLLLAHISFQLLLTLQISFQPILPLGISSHFPLPCPSQITFQKLLQFSQHTHIKRYKAYLSFLAFLSLPPSPHSLSLSLFFLALGFFGFASTSFCGLASTGFSSGLASTGFFGFVLSGVLQNSFALY